MKGFTDAAITVSGPRHHVVEMMHGGCPRKLHDDMLGQTALGKR